MIVVDNNIIVYFYLPSPFSEAAQQAFAKQPRWIAPHLWRSELRNVLARYVSKGQLQLSVALEMQQHAESLFHRNEYEVDSAQVIRLAAASGCSAYDCEYLLLAQNFNVPLLTEDKQVLRAFPTIAQSLAQFLA